MVACEYAARLAFRCSHPSEPLSSIDGPLLDTDAPDPDGNVEAYTTTLSDGTHVVTLRAIDDDREQAEDTVTITIMEVPELPSITIDHPTGDERGLEDTPFVFMATMQVRARP